jgi:hypothetical protein
MNNETQRSFTRFDNLPGVDAAVESRDKDSAGRPNPTCQKLSGHAKRKNANVPRKEFPDGLGWICPLN